MRILLAEDDVILGDGLRAGLRQLGFQVDWVRDGVAAERELASGDFAAAVLDLGLPQKDGLEVLRAVRARKISTPVLVLTARDAVPDRVLGLDLGADDYVTKPFSPREVCARVRAILRRSAGRPATALNGNTQALLQLDETAQRIRCGDQWLALTRYEYRLLATLLKRPQRIFSRAELMDLVWADAPDTADRTVDAHVKLLRAKLREAGASAELIQTHRNMGYSLQLAA